VSAYYNEHDAKTAAWLRELIKAGLIADGEVDTRSIEDVRPDELRSYRQCHFFAGIGGWSLALRLAGWPDDRAVWTGSCPCQPFSAAGKGDGFADERHLWPAWHWLIEQRRPVVVFGEQVESPAARAWLDLVSTDLEGTGYACGASDLPVAGVGAPGIRQRLFWVADSENANGRREQSAGSTRRGRAGLAGSGEALGLADSDSEGWRIVRGSRVSGDRDASQRHDPDGCVAALGLVTRLEGHGGDGGDGYESRRLDADAARSIAATGATRGAWADADWLYCRDETFRPVEPGTFPLAYGLPARVGRLRGYGNAINPYVAAAFIGAYMSRDPQTPEAR
jgi:DNA (cytosine-5)-methyltransferase 1